MIELKQNENRSTAAIAVLWVIFAIKIISIISSYFQYKLINTFKTGAIDMNKANANDSREAFIAYLYVLAFIVSAILFIRWFSRAFNNLHQLMDNMDTRPAATIYSWFIPFYNLFKPYQIMRDMYKYTTRILENHNQSELYPLNSRKLGIWWALWIIWNLSNNFTFNFYRNPNTIEDVLNYTIIQIALSIFALPLILITIKVIKDYANVESVLHDIAFEIDDEAGDLNRHLVV